MQQALVASYIGETEFYYPFFLLKIYFMWKIVVPFLVNPGSTHT